MPPPGPGGKIIMELVTKQKEMAEREEIIMVREFQRDLAYNMKKVHPRALAALAWEAARCCEPVEAEFVHNCKKLAYSCLWYDEWILSVSPCVGAQEMQGYGGVALGLYCLMRSRLLANAGAGGQGH